LIFAQLRRRIVSHFFLYILDTLFLADDGLRIFEDDELFMATCCKDDQSGLTGFFIDEFRIFGGADH